jgi:hypothetical protein
MELGLCAVTDHGMRAALATLGVESRRRGLDGRCRRGRFRRAGLDCHRGQDAYKYEQRRAVIPIRYPWLDQVLHESSRKYWLGGAGGALVAQQRARHGLRGLWLLREQ